MLKRNPVAAVAVVLGVILLIAVLVKIFNAPPVFAEPSYLGIHRGMVISFGEPREPPYVLFVVQDWQKGTTYGSHRVMSVDLDDKVIRLRTVDGSKIHVTLPFGWIAAVSKAKPLLDVDFYGDDDNK